MKSQSQKNQYDESKTLQQIRRVMDLWRILHNDTLKALKEMEATDPNDDKMRYRERTFVRTFFAMVEGVCYGMRDLCSHANLLPDANKISDKELKGFEKRRPPIDEVVQFSFSSLCSVIKKDFVLDINNPGFAALVNAKNIRNRLMHPKSSYEMMLSRSEIVDTRMALTWFAREMERWRTKSS